MQSWIPAFAGMTKVFDSIFLKIFNQKNPQKGKMTRNNEISFPPEGDF